LKLNFRSDKPIKKIRVPLVGGRGWWWRTVPANRGAAVAVASLFLYVLSGIEPRVEPEPYDCRGQPVQPQVPLGHVPVHEAKEAKL
jgi:hypothetical protein